MKTIIGNVFRWAANIIIALLVIVVALSVYSVIQSRKNGGQAPSVAGYRILTVLSGSMSPFFEAGDMLISKDAKPEDIKIGDVITFKAGENMLVTHRVVDVIESGNGQRMFKTKGDANSVEDSELVSSEELMCLYKFRIPYGGYVANYIKGTQGFILIVIVPAIILIAGLLKTIIAEMDDGTRKKTEAENNPGK